MVSELKLNEVVFKSKFDEMTNYHIGKQTTESEILLALSRSDRKKYLVSLPGNRIP